MKNVFFKLLCFLLAVSLCCMCVCADDVLPDSVSTGDSGGGAGETSDTGSEDDSNNTELSDDVGFYDTLIVNELVVEGEDEAAALAAEAEIYSISPNVQYGAYFHANITDFGDAYVYIPVAYASDSFSYNSDGVPINITASTITGYVAGSNSNQSIQFPSFGIPRYRVSNNYDYTYLTDWEEIDSTVTVYTEEDNFYSYSEIYFLRFVVLLLGADVVLNFFIRLLGGVKS